MSAAPLLSVYCDGSAHGRAGLPGGWAFAVVLSQQLLLEGSGGERITTSNAMELQAVLQGLEAVRVGGWYREHPVELVSDSRVALEVASGLHVPVHLEALVRSVREVFLEVGARTRWIRGHSGEAWNDRVDALAHEAKQALVPMRVRRKQLRRG